MDDLIRRSDAIEHAEVNGESREFILRMIDYLEDAETVEPKHGEWIPCSERLPSEDASVIAQYSDGSITAIKHARPSYWNRITTHRIVAWMPLPEPYMKGAGE